MAGAGQDIAAFPKLLPSNITSYGLEQGMPITCAWDGLEDQKGRLWITPCFGQAEHQTVNFYQFDGRRAKEIRWDQLPDGADGQACLVGMADDGELYGFFRKTNHFYFFDPDTRKTRFYQIDRKQADIIFMAHAPKHGLIVLAAYANRQLIYQLQNDTLQLILEYESSIDHDKDIEKDRFFPNYQLLAGDDLWFCEARDMVFDISLREKFKILQFNLRDHSLKQYTLQDLFGESPLPPLMFQHRVNLVSGPGGKVLLADRDHVYQIDPKTGKASLRWVFPHAMDHISYLFDYRIERDVVGNLLFLFPDSRNRYVGVLMDTTGQLYDYSAVLKATVETSRFPDILHYNMWSRDFRRSILAFQQGGLIAADLQFYGAISTYLRGDAMRGIAEWRQDEYLVRPENIERFYLLRPFAHPATEPLSPSVPFGHPFHPLSMSTLVAANGYWWYSSGNNLVRMDKEKTCTALHVGAHFTKFVFLDQQTIALVAGDGRLCFFDLQSNKLTPWLENGRPLLLQGDINELFVAKDGALWIATLRGLWQVDLKAGKSRHFGRREGFQDERMMCLQEGDQGRIWVGTYTEGLQIYDPATGAIEVLNRSTGLSNNTVVGILCDEEGLRWVSTYSGINLVSAQGVVLAQLFQEDGLSTNEFNRYSCFRDSKGRLLFGSVDGVNRIDPELLKKQLSLSGELRIFLTGITRYDDQKGADSTRNDGFDQLGILQLPADRRYLSLNFALSSLIRLDDHNFFYKIEGRDQPNSSEWIYLGNKSQLDLPNLPPGRYNILIRGSGHRGNMTPNPLVVEVEVAEFFYKTVWFYLLLFLIFSGIGLAFFLREIGQRRYLEKVVEERTHKIQQDKQLIEQQALQLQELDEAKSRFFTNISHEFRTPLTVISGMATQIRQQPGQWLEKGMELIQRNSQQLLSLINQILDLRKLESGALAVNLVRGNIIPYLRYIAESFIQLAQTKGLRIHVLASTDTVEMDYDPDKMMHILSNLLSNAIKYTPAPGDIYLQIDLQDNGTGLRQLSIQVKDTGPGIAPEALPYIFDQFYQVEDLATQKPQGSGVGLALTKELVQLLKGSIEVTSTPGAGTTFSLRFPISREARVQEGQIIPATENLVQAPQPVETRKSTTPFEGTTAGSSQVSNGQASLLIVEDNADVRLYLTACLESHYQLLLAKDGQEGIELAIEQVPDLIVSDVMMPVKDGLALCETLKNDERTSHIPIVLLTAKADLESRLSGLRRGADAYLAKPFEQEELLVRLEQLLALRAKLQERYRHPGFTGSPSESEAVQAEDAFILKLRQLVLDHLSEEDYGIVHLCRALGLGRTQLHNKIKALTGQSTSEFIRTIRLNQARELLQTTELNVSEVSYEVGISNPAYFSRIYAEEFGEAPRETRG